jgi:hypothetical protein
MFLWTFRLQSGLKVSKTHKALSLRRGEVALINDSAWLARVTTKTSAANRAEPGAWRSPEIIAAGKLTSLAAHPPSEAPVESVLHRAKAKAI